MSRSRTTEEQSIARNELIRRQARKGDSICAEYLSLQASNAKIGGGYAFIETMLDMQDEFDDDFRPY